MGSLLWTLLSSSSCSVENQQGLDQHPRPDYLQLWGWPLRARSRSGPAVQETLPNTRTLYALRRKPFSKRCALHHLVRYSVPRKLARVFAFLQELLDTGNSPSALEVHVASMASHWGLINFSLGSKSPSCTPLQKVTASQSILNLVKCT